MSYRLLVLACSQRKKPGPGYMPAIERYDGPLWQTLRSIEQPENLAVMALSARYGIFRSCLGIEVYDDRMTPEFSRAAAGPGVCDPFRSPYQPHWKGTVNELRDARDAVRYRHGTRYSELFGEVCLVGGGLYLDVMRLEIRRFMRRGGQQCITTDARVTEINGPIGKMRQAMRAWICGAAHISRTKLVDIRARNSDDVLTPKHY